MLFLGFFAAAVGMLSIYYVLVHYDSEDNLSRAASGLHTEDFVYLRRMHPASISGREP